MIPRDLVVLSRRSLRAAGRDLGARLPSLVVPLFMLALLYGTLERSIPGSRRDYLTFITGTALLFSMTGLSRAAYVVEDLTSGYFDRLLTTPVSRRAILLAEQVTDLATALVLSLLLQAVGVALGVRPAGGPLGMVVVALLGATWAVAFSGFAYAIAYRTASLAAVAGSFYLFLPVSLVTTAMVPREEMAGWLSTTVGLNPATAVVAGMRQVLAGSWDGGALARALLAILVTGLAAQWLAERALHQRSARA